MDTLFGYTILVDLALLAIEIAIYIFAITIYKGASELSIKEKEKASNRSKEIIAIRRKELSEKVKTVHDGPSINEAKVELSMLDSEIRAIDRSIVKIISRTKGLSAKYLVFIPESLLIFSIITSAISLIISGNIQNVIWYVSLFLLASSIYFIFRGICNIEFFSNSIDLSTLMEQALERHSNKSKPVLDMQIYDSTLNIKHGEIGEIWMFLSLKNGTLAKNTQIRFMSTDELNFPEEKLEPFPFEKKQMKNPKVFFHKAGDIGKGVHDFFKVKVKTPDELGDYFMSYWIMANDFTGEEIFFKITVI